MGNLIKSYNKETKNKLLMHSLTYNIEKIEAPKATHDFINDLIFTILKTRESCFQAIWNSLKEIDKKKNRRIIMSKDLTKLYQFILKFADHPAVWRLLDAFRLDRITVKMELNDEKKIPLNEAIEMSTLELLNFFELAIDKFEMEYSRVMIIDGIIILKPKKIGA